MKTRIVTWLLVLCMVFAMLPVTAFADEITYIENQSFTFINPLYADTITEDDLVKPSHIAPFSTYASRNGYYDATTASELVRAGMVAREENIIVNVCCDFNSMDTVEQDMANLAENVLDAAMVHTGNPVEGDYLRWQCAGCRYEVDAWTDGISLNMTITYTMTYYTSATQEAQLDAAVSNLLSQLNVSDLSDYGKLKTIYDYITSHVTYDYANLNNDSYNLKFTAYAALMHKTAVCQGYALLLYRLALELDVDCRLIAGIGNGGNHGWNIAKIGEYYYNLDATWDAGRTTHRYFLVSPGNFIDHVRWSEYETAAFHKEYPMATTNYVPVADSVCVTSDVPYRGGYWDAANQRYVRIAATKNKDGSYTFTAPNGIVKVMVVVMGDVNEDEKVSVSDIAALNAYLCNKKALTAEDKFAADVNGDGVLNRNDISVLVAALLGKVPLAWEVA